jgi:hypothetical protein
LAAAGVAVFADDAQAIGRRRNRGSANCCPGPAMVAPASPCCGAAAGAPTFVGAAGIPGNVIVSGEAVPNPMPGTTTVTTIPGTNLIPATNLPGTTVTTPGAVIPTSYYYSGTPGGVIQVAGTSPYYTPRPYYTPGTPVLNAEAAAVNTVRRGLFFRRW